MSDAKKLDLAREIYPDSKRARKESFSPAQWAGVERAWAWVVETFDIDTREPMTLEETIERVRKCTSTGIPDAARGVPDAPMTATARQYTVDLSRQTLVHLDACVLCGGAPGVPQSICHASIHQPKEPTVKQEPTIYGAPIIEDAHMPSGYGLVGVNMSAFEKPHPPWTDAQRQAAYDLAFDARPVLNADSEGGTIEGVDAASYVFCAAIAKIAAMFVEKPWSVAKINRFYGREGVALSVVKTDGRSAYTETIPWSEILKHVPPGSVVESVKFHAATPAPSPAPAASHPGIPDNSAEPAPATDGVPDLDECMRTYWLAHSAHESADDPKREAVSAVRDLFVRTRDERIAELKRQLDMMRCERDTLKVIASQAQDHNASLKRKLEDAQGDYRRLDAVNCAVTIERDDARATIATLTKERDEARAESARVSGLREQLNASRVLESDRASDRDAALARVAELEKRGAVDVEACAREINEMAYQQSKGYIGSGYYLGWRNIEAILRKHSRDVRRITREELYRMADAHYEARTGSCLSSAPPESALKIREEIAVCLQAALRAIGFEVEA